MASRPAAKPKKKINLGLQGGGAHGAFTWGVIDRILEQPDVEIEAISGTSAGAMNAAVVADGYQRGGADGARALLREFWHAISKSGEQSVLQRMPWDKAMFGWNLDPTPQAAFFDMMSRMTSPYELPIGDYHPLRDVLTDILDFDNLGAHSKIKLFINTTNVNTGKVRVFNSEELSVDVLLASACLPFLFKAIEIDGQSYWDGGYMGNPAIFPLIYGAKSKDVIIVQINPFTRQKTPTSAREILDRVNEISFNSSLMREMRVISFFSNMVEEEGLDPEKYKRLNVHFIEAEKDMKDLGIASKLNAEWAFLEFLFELGRNTAADWIEDNWEHVGLRSTVDFSKFT